MKTICRLCLGNTNRQRQLTGEWAKRLAALSVALVMGIVSAAAPSWASQRKRPSNKVAAAKQESAQKHRITPAVSPATSEVTLERLPPDPAVENADIAITAHVRAQSLKFEVVPNPTVEFFGQPARDTVWEAQRENLPTPVQPGVTYRDIGIRLKITSVFRDIDRIVAEALGEVPITEDVTTPSRQDNTTTAKTVTIPSPTTTRPPSRRRP